jgi:hypothetical protein
MKDAISEEVGALSRAGIIHLLQQDSGVAQGYRHTPKWVMPREPMSVDGALFKWYQLALKDDPVQGAIEQLARVFLSGANPEAKGFGFVILHRCGTAGFHFLLVNTWRGNNELWESVYYKKDDVTPNFALFPREGIHKPAFCVWELAAVWHEARAWARFLQSARDESALRAWAADRYSGEA